MHVQSAMRAASSVPMPSPIPQQPVRGDQDEAKLRQVFDETVGQTLFGQLLKQMRKTVGKPAYFHGGRGEEVFQQQLDQVLAEKLSRASADQITGPMFELFMMSRR